MRLMAERMLEETRGRGNVWDKTHGRENIGGDSWVKECRRKLIAERMLEETHGRENL